MEIVEKINQTGTNSTQMSNRPSCVNLKRMKIKNRNPRTEVCATKGLLLMAAGR